MEDWLDQWYCTTVYAGSGCWPSWYGTPASLPGPGLSEALSALSGGGEGAKWGATWGATWGAKWRAKQPLRRKLQQSGCGRQNDDKTICDPGMGMWVAFGVTA